MDNKKESMLQRAVYKFDRYGIPLNLNFDGKRTYQSKLGFALTIIQITIVFLYLSFQIKTVNNRSDIKIYSQESFLDSDLTRKANISSKDIGLDFRIQYYGTNSSWQGDEVYTLFSPVLTNDFLNGTKVDEPYKLEGPDSNTFTSQSYPPSSTGVWTGNDAILTTQSVVKGFMRLEIFFCQQTILEKMFPGKKCKSQQESLEAIAGVQVYIQTKYQYFDTTNFTEPLKWKTQLETFGLSKQFSHSRVILIREKYLKLRDSLVSSDFNSEDIKYYAMSSNSNYYVNDISYKSRMLSYNLVLDETTETTIREVRNYGQAFSAIGGLLGFITVINMAIVNFFVRSEIDVDLISYSFRQNNLKGESFYQNAQTIKQLIVGKTGKILSLQESICLKLTASCPFLRSRHFKRKQLVYERATNLIAQEISIQNLIKISRMTKLLTKILLPPKIRSISKQLLFKEIVLHEKNKEPRNQSAQEFDIKKLMDKKSPVYKRFLKYALGPFNNNHCEVELFGELGNVVGRDKFERNDIYDSQLQKIQGEQVQQLQYEQQQQEQQKQSNQTNIVEKNAEPNMQPMFPLIKQSGSVHDKVKKKRSNKDVSNELEKTKKKKVLRNQLPQQYDDNNTDDQDSTLRKLNL